MSRKHANCYKVVLPTTNALKTTSKIGKDGELYITTNDNGVLYVFALDINAVARMFDNATIIEYMGIAYRMSH